MYLRAIFRFSLALSFFFAAAIPGATAKPAPALAIPAAYASAGAFNGGLAPVCVADHRCGYIDTKGKTVIPAVYLNAYAFNGVIAVVETPAGFRLIDRQGRPLIDLPAYAQVSPFQEGLAQVLVMDDDGVSSRRTLTARKKGYIDLYGEEAIPPRYYEASEFREGLAAVALTPTSRYGFIDAHGDAVLPPAYDEAQPFSEGLAAVRKDGRWSFIDKKGKVALKTACVALGDFDEGLAACKTSGGKLGFIDRQGKVVVKASYLYKPGRIYAYGDGLAGVATAKGTGFIDKTGRTIVQPVYEDVGSFQEGYAAVKKDGKWGYIARPRRK